MCLDCRVPVVRVVLNRFGGRVLLPARPHFLRSCNGNALAEMPAGVTVVEVRLEVPSTPVVLEPLRESTAQVIGRAYNHTGVADANACSGNNF